MLKAYASNVWTRKWAEMVVMLPAYVLIFVSIIKLQGVYQTLFFIACFFSLSPLYRVLFITRPSFLRSLPRLGIVVLIWLVLAASMLFIIDR